MQRTPHCCSQLPLSRGSSHLQGRVLFDRFVLPFISPFHWIPGDIRAPLLRFCFRPHPLFLSVVLSGILISWELDLS